MKLWHCSGARSLRPLWALEELELDYVSEDFIKRGILTEGEDAPAADSAE